MHRCRHGKPAQIEQVDEVCVSAETAVELDWVGGGVGRDGDTLARADEGQVRGRHLAVHPHGAQIGHAKGFGIVLEQFAHGEVFRDDRTGRGGDDLVPRQRPGDRLSLP